MIRKTRLVLAFGLVLALGVAGIAFADGVSENDAQVQGEIKPTKLSKKEYKPVSLFSGVITRTTVDGTQSNPVSEYLSYPKNIKFDFNAGDVCTALPPSGSTPEQARSACPKDSYLGSGAARVERPNAPASPINDIVVSVFRGPDKKGIQLHTYSPTLLAASPTVQGSIVKSNAGGQYGYALSVPHAPETGALMISEFNATISKKSKAVLARCKSKSMTFERRVTYTDGSTETTEIDQSCKRKKK